MGSKVRMMWANRIRARTLISHNRSSRSAFTLFEVLLTLAIIACILGATIPFLGNLFDPSDAIEIDVRTVARDARRQALDSGQAQRVKIAASAIEAEMGSTSQLPDGWSFKIRRFGESEFRKLRNDETWEFNSEGICEPIALRAESGSEYIMIEFDPLTALGPPR